MTTLGELLKDGYTTVDESETFIHLRNEKRQNILYSRKTGTYIPFIIDSRQTKPDSVGRLTSERTVHVSSSPDARMCQQAGANLDKTADNILQAIRDYDGWGARE